jgi:hypothetical protein
MSDSSRTLPPEALDEWAAALRERFGLASEDLPIPLILDLARDVAHDVADRPRRSARSSQAWSRGAQAALPPTPRRPSPPSSSLPRSGRSGRRGRDLMARVRYFAAAEEFAGRAEEHARRTRCRDLAPRADGGVPGARAHPHAMRRARRRPPRRR